MNDWSSGWREWCEAHSDADEDVVFAEFGKRQDAFDYDKFVTHYDNLSEDEWRAVIQDALDKGYDIRSVLCYKKEYEDERDFTIEDLPEIIDVLLCMDGASALMPLKDTYISRPDFMRELITDRYARFQLPVPEYWRERLWS